jgi:cytochrome c peroxidase
MFGNSVTPNEASAQLQEIAMPYELPRTVMLSVVVAFSTLGVPAHGQDQDTVLLQQARALFQKLPTDFGDAEHPITPERVALGKALFFDPRWSVDRNVSCATCHNPALYGTDALSKSIGVKGKQHLRNAPTVFNVVGHISANWRGERRDVEDQAITAAIAPFSTGHTEHAAWMAQIEAIGGYPAMFQRAFPNEAKPISPANLGLAIGAYERTLVTPAPFDSYLDGNISALAPQARAGLQTFINTGCVACHSGVGVGGGLYRKFGLHLDYWKATGSQEIDKGRFDLTKNEADLYVFKVPSLRNVAMTAPYLHDGSVATLPEAVRVMARTQIGKVLAEREVEDIVAFLNSLTGELPKDFATAPTLPPSGGR